MLIEEVLTPLLKDGKVTSHSQLINVLEEKSKSGQTTKLWVGVLIKQLFSSLSFIRAEWEGDCTPHLETVKNMIPLFFAAGPLRISELWKYCQTMPTPTSWKGSTLSRFLLLHGHEYSHIWESRYHTLESVKEHLGLLGNQQIRKLWMYGLTA